MEVITNLPSVAYWSIQGALALLSVGGLALTWRARPRRRSRDLE